MTAAGISFEEVEVGEELPELAIDITPSTVVLGALATRDWRPMHHDKDFAQERNGTRHIFINTPHNAAYFERYITDWTGPRGRLGKIQFRMSDSVFPGDTMVFHGKVEGKEVDEAGCGWVDLSIQLDVGDTVTTSCRARVALPSATDDNPWKRKGEAWRPSPSS
ncbi:MAG: MaoC/PaaZ C-terminal domain-containing protein [Myxococcota bacterium]|nr:MaoC/PaaZ C-terminal domain-containing protein [Myxococcota bacterium]